MSCREFEPSSPMYPAAVWDQVFPAVSAIVQVVLLFVPSVGKRVRRFPAVVVLVTTKVVVPVLVLLVQPTKAGVANAGETSKANTRRRRFTYRTTRQFKVMAPGVIEDKVLLQTLKFTLFAVGYLIIVSIPEVLGA